MSLQKKIKLNHFEGGKNLTQGQEQAKEQHLAKLVQDLEAEGQVLAFQSDAGAGGGATEAMTFTGLKTTDQILGVTQRVPGGNNLAMIGWNTLIANGMTIVWAADPGANAIVVVEVKRVPLS